MKRIIIILSSLILVTLTLNAQTYYYKMCSFTQGGATNTNVTGGQFITFCGAMCMETDVKGKPCGNGTLQRKMQNKNLYVGSSFWGPKTKFVFSSDRSSLEVTAPNGVVYSYKRSNAPQGVTTSSLINGGNSGGSYGGASSFMTTTNNSNSGATNNNSNSGYKKTAHPRKCTSCAHVGNGKCKMCRGTGKWYNTASSAYQTCPHCNGTGKCQVCNGTGTTGNDYY